jgi:hypothetical protein
MKRNRTLVSAARGWVNTIRKMERLASEMPEDLVHRLRYEDLCAAPHQEIERLCQFLSIDFRESMLVRSTDNLHHLGGSPSKFQKDRQQIRKDKSADDSFSEAQLAEIKSIVGDVPALWGYD